MSDLLIKNLDAWVTPKQVLVKKDDVWKPTKSMWIKTNGTWARVFPTSGQVIYDRVGTYTFKVPNGVYSVNIAYFDPISNNKSIKVYEVTPGQSISVEIPDVPPKLAKPPTSASKFGTFTLPIIDVEIFTFSGMVDMTDTFTLNIGSATGATLDSKGKKKAHEQNATAKGITLVESNERSHGDLTSTIRVRTIPTEFLVGPCCIYRAKFKGRYSFKISLQPSATNNFKAAWTPDDIPPKDEGSYSYAVNYVQISTMTITW